MFENTYNSEEERIDNRLMVTMTDVYIEEATEGANNPEFVTACYACESILEDEMEVRNVPDQIIRKMAEKIQNLIGWYEDEVETDLDKLRPAVYAEFAKIQSEYWKAMISGTKGKFFRVTFIKANGEIRTMQARTGVKKGVKGTGYKLNPGTNAVRVSDIRKGAFRTIPCSRVISMTAKRQTYVNVTRAIA